MDAVANFAYSTVAVPPSPATSGTSLTTAGGNFPAAPFNIVIWPAGAQPLLTNAEVVRVTAKSGDTFTITRQQEATSARTVVETDQLAAMVTAKVLSDIHGEPSVLEFLADVVTAYDTVLAANHHAVMIEEYVMSVNCELVFGDLSEMAFV